MRGGKRDRWRKAEHPDAVGEARNGAFLQVCIPGIDIRLERELREKRDIPHASELQVAGLPPCKIVEVFSKGGWSGRNGRRQFVLPDQLPRLIPLSDGLVSGNDPARVGGMIHL